MVPALCAAAALAVLAVVAERSSAEDAVIAQRQEAMKGMGGQMKIINAYVEKGEGDPAAVAAAAMQIQETSGKIPSLFPAGTSMEEQPDKNEAKSAIWENWAAFEAAAAKLGDLAGATAAAAEGGDKQAITDSFTALGKDGCGGCHSQFRQKTS
jgi:cytochrome c556